MHLLARVTYYKDKVAPVTKHNSGTNTKPQHPRHSDWEEENVKLLALFLYLGEQKFQL